MLNENFVYLGILINAIGSLSYLIYTARGKIKPNRVTFFIWSIAPFVAFAAQKSQGVGLQSLMTFTVGLFPLLIFITSLVNKKAYWKLTMFDLTCGALSLMGLLLWYLTKVGNIAVFFGALADGLAALPTIVKAYYYPETESAWPWFASFMQGVIILLTIKQWTFEYYGFPIYYTITVFVIFVLVQFKLGKLIRNIL